MVKNYLEELNNDRLEMLADYTVGVTVGSILKHVESLDADFVHDYLTSNNKVKSGEMVIHLSVTKDHESLCDGVILEFPWRSEWCAPGVRLLSDFKDELVTNHITRMGSTGRASYEVAHATVLVELVALWAEAWTDMRDIPPSDEYEREIGDIQYQLVKLGDMIRNVVVRLSALAGGDFNALLQNEPTAIPVFILNVDLTDDERSLAFRPWLTSDRSRMSKVKRTVDRLLHYTARLHMFTSKLFGK